MLLVIFVFAIEKSNDGVAFLFCEVVNNGRARCGNVVGSSPETFRLRTLGPSSRHQLFEKVKSREESQGVDTYELPVAIKDETSPHLLSSSCTIRS